jgi:histidinol-phosphate aminotransferase
MTAVNDPGEAVYLAPPSVAQLSARLGVDPSRLVKLDANENPYGAPPAALRALAEVAANRYPDAEVGALRSALAEFTGCPADRIVVGNGSDELIDLLCRLVLRPGDNVVVTPPTFSLYALAARFAGADVLEIARPVGEPVDIDGLVEAVNAQTKIVFLCSPNNPTGESLSEDEVRRVLALGPLVVLDEAYAEFAGCSLIQLALEYDNLVVLRTFSKAFGLAGLRVGYGAFPAALARQLEAHRLPYNVNAAAQAAAHAALFDLAWVEDRLVLIRQERDRLYAELSALHGLAPLPSETNFLLIGVNDGKAAAIYAALLDAGIMVRHFMKPPLDDYLRITVGTPEQNNALLGALSDILRKEIV